jgi:hypothetical protein
LLRRGEVFATRWKRFDPEAATLRVVEAVYDHVIDTPKTQKSMRGAIVGNSEDVNSQVYTKTIAESLRNAVYVVSNELCANCAPSSEMVN